MARSMRRSRRQTHASGVPEITLTPLIDTCLTLLIIFMVTSPMINNSIKVDLPKGKLQEVQGVQEDLVVHLDKQRHLYLNGTPFKKDKLLSELKKRVAGQRNKTVFVKGDGKVIYEEVFGLVEDIKGIGGIDRVALASAKAA